MDLNAVNKRFNSHPQTQRVLTEFCGSPVNAAHHQNISKVKSVRLKTNTTTRDCYLKWRSQEAKQV